MKQPEHNEIDSLLRAWAGRQPVVFTGQGSEPVGAHLDADELSSYAEGALPPSSRARYTSHLVDCDDCRKIVVQLSLAAGPVLAESKASRQTVASGWRQMLAMLFAPAVLKFAVPALALVVVGALFVTSRRQSERYSVALNNQSENRPSSATPHQGNAGSTFNDRVSDQQAKESPPKAAARAVTDRDKAGEKDAKTVDTAGASASTRAGNETEEGKKKPADESERKDVAAVAQPSYAPEPPPAAAKPASSNQPKEQGATASVRVEPSDAAARKRESERSASSPAATAGATTGGQHEDRPKAKSMSGARANETRRDDSSETRSVAGRRFQKRDGVWVDSAYNSAMSVTRIPRGSEQYRALIADEPEIGTIAKQLSGEVILIWKGRAYRIN